MHTTAIEQLQQITDDRTLPIALDNVPLIVNVR